MNRERQRLHGALLAMICGGGWGLLPRAAAAVEAHLSGFLDLRAVRTPDEVEWIDGGLGKTRFGAEPGDPDTRVRLGELSLLGALRLTSELEVFGHARLEQTQEHAGDLIEGFLRWRPVSTTAWRWTVKAGAYFPPVSLENEGIGWTARYTLTPSAINSWIGEEFKSVGAEVRLQYRMEQDSLELVGSVFGWNDPAGILLAYRGWALHDRWSGVFERPRLPDESAMHLGRPIPFQTAVVREIDDRPGFYAGATYRRRDVGRVTLLRYDNRADPTAVRRQAAWNTRFWSLGAEWEPPVDVAGGLLLAQFQAMTGSTRVAPTPQTQSSATYQAAHLLLGWERDAWRVGLRGDVFGTRERSVYPAFPELSEHGKSATAAVTWLPLDWLRLTAETLHVRSYRTQRAEVDLPVRAPQTQVQLSARIFF